MLARNKKDLAKSLPREMLRGVGIISSDPRDVLALAASLEKIPAVRVALARLAAERISTLHASADELSDLRARIDKTIVPGRDFGKSIEVVSGLGANDDVVVNPPDSLTDGAAVQIAAPSKPAAAPAPGEKKSL